MLVDFSYLCCRLLTFSNLTFFPKNYFWNRLSNGLDSDQDQRSVGLDPNCLQRLSADNFCNILDPDQVRQNVGPNLDPNCLTHRWYSRMVFFERKNNFESADNKKRAKACKITQ